MNTENANPLRVDILKSKQNITNFYNKAIIKKAASAPPTSGPTTGIQA